MPVLDTTSSGRKRRTASKGAYDLQHIVDKLIEQLPDTSMASSAPVMGFVVAFVFFFCLNFFQCVLEWNDICV